MVKTKNGRDVISKRLITSVSVVEHGSGGSDGSGGDDRHAWNTGPL